jgi:hypothetical protein
MCSRLSTRGRAVAWGIGFPKTSTSWRSRSKNLFRSLGRPWSNAIEGSDSDSKLTGYFSPSDSLAAQRRNPRNVHDPSRSAEPLPLRASISQSGLDAFNDQRALQFCDGTEDRENHLSHRRRCVHAFGERDKLNAERLKGFESTEQMRDRPSEAVEFPNHDGIEPSAVRIGQ